MVHQKKNDVGTNIIFIVDTELYYQTINFVFIRLIYKSSKNRQRLHDLEVEFQIFLEAGCYKHEKSLYANCKEEMHIIHSLELMNMAAILELVVKTAERNATAKHLDEIK